MNFIRSFLNAESTLFLGRNYDIIINKYKTHEGYDCE